MDPQYLHLFPDELEFFEDATRLPDDADATRARQHEIVTAPLVSISALARSGDAFPQRGLLGKSVANGERVYFNANTPSSGVVCGVQGAGKSHTVSCILENALLPDSRIGNLPQPLAALVFHFDEQNGDRPCEAAYLSAPSPNLANAPHVPRVTVLASNSNLASRKRAYAHLPNVDVRALYLAERDLSAPRMLSLMGWSEGDKMPLYLFTVMQMVRSMGSENFSYARFREQLKRERFDPTQQAFLAQRLRLLDGFMSTTAPSISSTFVPGQLVIVDLTDPYLDGSMASLLFDIVLGVFMNWNAGAGKIVVLDEAHKYLTNDDATRLNRTIASIIRQQRHLATRLIIATQEPTVIPATVLDLASFIVCHRFTSPSWCSHLSRHVSTGTDVWFEDVMRLATGEALVFSPGALATRDGEGEPQLLSQDALRIRVRPRLTCDGGASLLAVAAHGVEAALPSPPSSGSPALSPSSPAAPPGLPVPEPSSLWYGGSTAAVASEPAVNVPSEFKVLVRAIREQGYGEREHVYWDSLDGLSCFGHLRKKNTPWFKRYVEAARNAGIVQLGKSNGQRWLVLLV
ncbi:hypothetical protein AURDEDRAFT_65958 [Auricularia subglabra TFB-10046 SS5]|nr:hypothetical protein AURDEDRAFT_65958 [Auricularia subglabra TFB-10046 SS5]